MECKEHALANKILIIDDDEKLCEQITRFLRRFDYDVGSIHNGNQAVDAIKQVEPDLIVLDLMLPGLDGFEICRAIRPFFNGVILMLTASDDDMDHVVGIEIGADDFLIKPIHPRVLLARIKLLLRRNNDVAAIANQSPQDQSLSFGQLTIHLKKRVVNWLGVDIDMTDSEFDLLAILASQPEDIFSRDEILLKMRGIEYDGMDRSIDVKIASLRKKLDDNPKSPKKILTVRGKGYMLVPDEWEH